MEHKQGGQRVAANRNITYRSSFGVIIINRGGEFVFFKQPVQLLVAHPELNIMIENKTSDDEQCNERQ